MSISTNYCNLANACKHLLINPSLLKDRMYRDQLQVLIENDEKMTAKIIERAFKEAEKGDPLPEFVVYVSNDNGKFVAGSVFVESLNPTQADLLACAFAVTNNCQADHVSIEQQHKGVL